jgi:hypothetical protein
MADELIKLILETSGQQGVQQLTGDLQRMEGELKQLVVQWQQGTLATDAFIKQSNVLSGSIGQTRDLLNGLTGKPGAGGNAGQGLLGASYAVQDFTSQLGTRGLVGALGAVQNNIPQILVSLGAGPGLTGIISIASVALGAMLPLIQKAFGGESQDSIEATRRRLQEFEAQAKATKEAFERLANKPTDYEEQSAESVKAILEARPNADRVRKALEAGAGRNEILDQLKPGDQEKLNELNKKIKTDAQIRLEALGDVSGRSREEVQRELEFERREATHQRDVILNAARRRFAQSTVEGSLVAGPKGNAARERLMQLAPDDIKRELAGSTPEAIKAWQDSLDKSDEDNNAWLAKKPLREFRRAKSKERARKAAEARADVAKRIKSDTDAKNKAAKARSDESVKKRDDRAKDLAEEQRKRAAQAKLNLQNEKKLESTLGDEFLANAERSLLDARPSERGNVRNILVRQAQKVLESKGVAPMEATGISQALPGFLDRDIGRQLRGMGSFGKGKQGLMNLYQALGEQLAMMQANQGEMAGNQSEMIQRLRQQGGDVRRVNQKNRSQMSESNW